MKSIEQLLDETEGLELTEEQRKAIVDGVKANYKTVAETNAKAERIADLEAQLKERDEAIGKLEGDAKEVEALRKQVSDFEAAETKRKADEAKAEAASEFEKRFDAAIAARSAEEGNRLYPLAREALIPKVREACERDSSLTVADAIAALTKDAEGVFVNPQQDVKRMPADIGSGAGASEDSQKKAFAARLFGSSRNNE